MIMRLFSSLSIISALLIGDASGFCSSSVSTQRRSSCLPNTRRSIFQARHQSDEEQDDDKPSIHRRSLLASTFAAAYCTCCHPFSVNAAIELTQTSTNNLRPRSKLIDSIFAEQMATGMIDYEKEVEQYKAVLFQKLFNSLASESNSGGTSSIPVIVDVGMGTFPNAKYYAQALSSGLELKGFDIIGVDPNSSMTSYAQDNARLYGLSSSLRTVNGVAEDLPFADGSVDAVVTTLTLCSVVDQTKALSEIRRVLKPNGGKFLFWEHVLSEDDNNLALQQKLLNPIQTFSADGCHLNRRTGLNIQKAFDGNVDLNYVNLEDKWVIGPTTFGIATV